MTTWWRELLYLRKSDRKVILVLLCVIVAGLGIIFLTGGEEETTGLAAADTLITDSTARHPRRSGYHRVDTIYMKPRYYYRNPTKTTQRMPAADNRQSVSSDTVPAPRPHRHKISPGEQVVLNTADTTALQTIPGIGPYYARRIVQYGERLGGYVSVDQIDEIGEIPAEVKGYLTIEAPSPRRMNINRLTLNELRRHPYINFYQAKAITDYRRLHGSIHSLNDLRLSKDFPPEEIQRLTPYVEY